MRAIFETHLGDIYLVYGLAFVLLGALVAVSPRRGGLLPYASFLWLIAAFGFLHGAYNLLLFRLMQDPDAFSASRLLLAAWLLISFVPLFEFGRRQLRAVLTEARSPIAAACLWPPVAYGVAGFALAIVAQGAGDPAAGLSAGARYAIAFPGAVLAGVGLLGAGTVQAGPSLGSRCRWPQTIAALAFIVYGLLALVLSEGDPHWTLWRPTSQQFMQGLGLPVELLRAAVAVLTVSGLLVAIHRAGIEAQRELSQSQRLLQTILDTLPVYVSVKDPSGRYQILNRRVRESLPPSSGDLVGRTIEDNPFASGERKEWVLEAERRLLATGEVQRHDELLTPRAPGAKTWERVTKLPLHDDSGRIFGILTVGEDITERKQAQDELHASQQLLQTILDTLPVYVTVKDTAGRYRIVNRRVLDSIPPSSGTLVGRTIEDNPAVSKVQREWVREADRRLIATGEVQRNEELPTRRAPGADTWERVTKLPLRDGSGRVTGILTVGEDITGRKRAEETLRQSQRLLQTAFDAIPYRMMLKGRDRRIQLVNRAWAEQVGLSPGDAIGRTSSEFAHFTPGTARLIDEADDRVLEQGFSVEVPEEPFVAKDGSQGVNRVIKVPVRDETGAVIALVGVSEDITGRKRTEDALRQSQRLLQTVFDAVPYRMVLKDRHRRFLLVNRAAAEMFGVPPGECVGRKTSESSYFTPETARMIDEADDRVLEQGFPVEIPEEPFMTRDGRAGVSRVIKLPVRDETGAVVALVGVSEDITERKRTEDALRQSQRLLQTVFDAVPHSLYIKDRDRPFQLINRAGAGLYGLQPSDVIGRTSHDFSYATPETLHRIDEADTRVLEQGLPVEIPEQPFVTPDGRTGVGRVIKVPVRDETGAVVALVGVSEDITERKRTEDALRQSQRLLQTVFDAVPHRMYIKDRDRRFQMINRAGAELYGMQPSEVIGRTTREISYSSPETLRVIDEADTGVLAQGLPVEVPEILFVTPDGSLGVHRFIKLPVKDETGAVIALVGVSEDITGRKRAEETVRRSEAQLKTAQRIAKLGAWNWDIASDKVAWSDELYAIFGQDRASFVPTRETYMTRVEPEDRERLRATLLRTLASKTETRTEDEFRIRRPDGEVRTVRSVREIERAADGTPVRIVGAVQDITDYKRADASLKESEARFRMLFDQATEGIFILDSKGTYLDANASGCRMLGYSRDELLRLNLANVVAPGGKELALPSLGTIVCGETLVRERTLIRQDGTFLSVEVTATARPDGLMQALVRDITDRKRAEEALRKSEQRLAEAQRIARMGAWEQDLKTQELWWSDEQYRLFGLPPDGARVDFSVFMARVHPEDRAAIRKAREVAIATGNFEHEYRMVLPDGTARSIHTVIKATYDRDGAPVSLAGTSQDVTGHKRAEAERLELQDQLQRARRMETVGTLAGGVAHDFNNLLAPILGFAELLQSDLAGEPERAALVKPILEAALRGRDLTQRILLFSRKTTAPREPIQLAPILAEVLALLRATLPGSVAIRPCIAERMHAVEADSARVHSAVMNLCVNAAQAMPAGGILGVRLDEVELSGQPTYLGTRLTGRFARIEISDTGVGIAEAVMSHVFEPFFTTRDVGKGTGLGLSSVLGIVQEHGGAVDVHSRMGEGSTFTIYLPLAAASAAPSEHPDAAPIGGTESILCVDDEPGVLAVLNGMLERLGYRVSAYQQADAALAALRAEPHRFDLVISDFSMPEMPGDRMARHIHELRADLPVLVCTGNDERLPDEANRTPAIADLLLKPVALAQLARAVRRILDRRTLPAPLEAFPEERPGK